MPVPDYLAVAKRSTASTSKVQANAVGGINLPTSDMRSSTLFDGKVWDGSNPAEYANSFAMKRYEAHMSMNTQAVTL